jgi:uncharacterized membrane protein
MDKKNNDVILEGKIWALMGYLWILCLIPLIMKKDNEFSLFHARQGLFLFVSSVICSGLTCLPFIRLIGVLGNLVIFVLSIIGIIYVLRGIYWKIPLIGEYAEKIEL